MKRPSIALFFLLLMLTGVHSVFAEARVWEIDKAHTNFYFSVGHIFSKVQGHFNEYSGKVHFDPENLADSKFYFAISTDSVDTNVAKRDKHLQSADFFNSGKYPQIIFESIKITDTGNGLYKVLGKFTVKGQIYDLELPFEYAGIKNHPAAKGKQVIGFNGRVTIDRLAYKIGTGKFFDFGVVDKDVEIFVTLEGLSSK
jgi:polyisoprenoid-binding protein YceI